MADALSLAQGLSRYQPTTQSAIRRSQYLQDAMEQIGASGQKDPQSIAEALARVATAFVLKKGSDKADTTLAEALRGERASADAAALAGLESVFTPPPAPAPPQQPAPASAPAIASPAPQALAAALTAPQNRSNGSSPIGIRQNNPGNIRDTPIPWQGAVGASGGFENFDTPDNGIRALARNLMTYGKRGLNTAESIIGRWAPPTENNTGAYVQAVSQAMGAAPNAPLNMQDPQTLAKLSGAIIQHENGQNPYSPDQIMGGVQAAMGGSMQSQQATPMPPPMQPPPAMQPSASPQAMAPPQAPMQPPGRVTPEEVAFAKRLIADPRTREQGLTYAMELQKKNVTPVKAEITNVNGVPFAVNPYAPEAGATAIGIPQTAMNRTVTAQEAGINAPAGTTFSQSPTGKLDQVYAPPAGYERTESGVRFERGSAADPTAGGNLIEGEAKLRAEYGKATQEYQDARSAFSKVVQAAKDSTPASDIALIFGVMKTLDPGSTVREGEFATAQNSGSVPENILAAYNKALSGDRLLPEKRREFVNTAAGQFNVYEQRAKALNQRYEEMARSYGFEPGRVVSPLSPVERAAPQASPPVQGAKQGADGGWYVPDPNKPGSFPRLQTDAKGRFIMSGGKKLYWVD